MGAQAAAVVHRLGQSLGLRPGAHTPVAKFQPPKEPLRCGNTLLHVLCRWLRVTKSNLGGNGDAKLDLGAKEPRSIRSLSLISLNLYLTIMHPKNPLEIHFTRA